MKSAYDGPVCNELIIPSNSGLRNSLVMNERLQTKMNENLMMGGSITMRAALSNQSFKKVDKKVDCQFSVQYQISNFIEIYFSAGTPKP